MTFLDEFAQLNEDKAPWKNRVVKIRKNFPEVSNIDWGRVFREDPAILGKLINDIIKLDQVRTGKPGKRPSLAVKEASQKLRELRGEDYSVYPFAETLRVLASGLTAQQTATLLLISKSKLRDVYIGRSNLDLSLIERAAAAFDKHPSFFTEYRVSYLLAILDKKLMGYPESSIIYYEKVAGRNVKKAV